MGTRPDNGHVTPQHVYELGKLIQRGLPEKLPYGRDTSVIAHGLQCIRLFVHYHCSEFQTGKRFVSQSAALLAEQYRSLGGQLDSCAYYQIEKREQGAGNDERDRYVKKTFRGHGIGIWFVTGLYELYVFRADFHTHGKKSVQFDKQASGFGTTCREQTAFIPVKLTAHNTDFVPTHGRCDFFR